ncbi:MAG: putative holin [Thiohalospira sp.]
MIPSIPSILDKLRAWPWLVAALLTVVLVGWFSVHQIGVLIYSLAKLSLGAYLGYWIHRSIAPYARPHELEGEDRRNAIIARAIIVAGAMLALGVGL